MQALNGNKQEAGKRTGTTAPPQRPRHYTQASRRSTHTNVLTLAPASGLSLPSLAGVRQSFTFREDTALLIPVAEYLIEQGHATRREWNASDHELPNFIERGLDRLIRSTGYKHRPFSPSLGAALVDCTHWAYTDASDGTPVLRLLIEVDQCGGMPLGPATLKLERQHKGLGAAFYAVLTHSLYALCTTYDYQNADQAIDCMRENIAMEENVDSFDELSKKQRDSYELWDIDSAVPPSILKTVKSCSIPRGATKLLERYSKGRNANLITPLLALAALAPAMRANKMDEPEYPSLPSFVLFFRDHDGISAAFDDYAQTAMEGDQPQVFSKSFQPTDAKGMAQAFDSFTTAVKMYAAAAQLTAAVNGVK